MSSARVLKGDGTWPFVAEIDGEDIVIRNVLVTCFGGAHDPQDNGETASGVNTKRNPLIQGVALPMDGRQFKHLSPPEHRALDGSPVPRLPFHTAVSVTINGKPVRFDSTAGGVIDLGPGKQATKKDQPAHACDLTEAAARQFDPRANSRNFERLASEVRIHGAAKYAPPG